MAIQMRRGNNADYDESKIKPGEVAVATDTRQAYVGMGNGDAEELAFKRDLEDLGGGGGDGTTDHKKLINRDAADQHPISAITGLPEQLLRPGVNLLHNADWAYSLVNQRGHSGAVSNAYCIDRWIGNGTVTPVSGEYVTLASGATMTQRMEIIPEALIGKECTFSIDVDGIAEFATIAFPATLDGAVNTATLSDCTVELGFLSGEFTLCGVTRSCVPYIKITATADKNVKRVFLELGNTSHMEETMPTDIGEVLQICQRYAFVMSVLRYARFGVAVVDANATTISALLPCPVTMRVIPSISFLSGSCTDIFISIGNIGVTSIRCMSDFKAGELYVYCELAQTVTSTYMSPLRAAMNVTMLFSSEL